MSAKRFKLNSLALQVTNNVEDSQIPIWHAGGMDILGGIIVVPLKYSPPGFFDPIIGFHPPDFGSLHFQS